MIAVLAKDSLLRSSMSGELSRTKNTRRREEQPTIDFTGHSALYLLAHLDLAILPQLRSYVAAFKDSSSEVKAWRKEAKVLERASRLGPEAIAQIEDSLREISRDTMIRLSQKIEYYDLESRSFSLSKEESEEISAAKERIYTRTDIFRSYASFLAELGILRDYPSLLRQILERIETLLDENPKSFKGAHSAYFSRVQQVFLKFIETTYGCDENSPKSALCPSASNVTVSGQSLQALAVPPRESYDDIEREILRAEQAEAASRARRGSKPRIQTDSPRISQETSPSSKPANQTGKPRALAQKATPTNWSNPTLPKSKSNGGEAEPSTARTKATPILDSASNTDGRSLADLGEKSNRALDQQPASPTLELTTDSKEPPADGKALITNELPLDRTSIKNLKTVNAVIDSFRPIVLGNTHTHRSEPLSLDIKLKIGAVKNAIHQQCRTRPVDHFYVQRASILSHYLEMIAGSRFIPEHREVIETTINELNAQL